LRNTSMDELPQLFNVLKGEMSLVGPRPLITDEMEFSPSWREMRLSVKPGITGVWQVEARSSRSFHDWIKYDVDYVKNRSLWLDIKILSKTIKVVLKREGAY
jgi:lipopolysaccharide/colanic/teichoic acid biosynthesis glycosyltransferase